MVFVSLCELTKGARMNNFDYFQIITLIIFLSIFIGRSLWLRSKGTEVFRLGTGKKGLNALLEKSFIIFFPLWLFEIGIHALNLEFQILPSMLVKPLFDNHIISIGGVVFIFSSILIFSLALISFKSSWRVGIDTVAPGDLVTTCVFSLSRNPIFLSMNLYFLGTFLIYGTVFFLLCFIGIALGFHVQILHEESFLIEKYGDSYCEYMAKVHRYI